MKSVKISVKQPVTQYKLRHQIALDNMFTGAIGLGITGVQFNVITNQIIFRALETIRLNEITH